MHQVQIVRLEDCSEVIEAKLEQVDCFMIFIALVARANVLKTFNYDLCTCFHDSGIQMFNGIAIELEDGLLVEQGCNGKFA